MSHSAVSKTSEQKKIQTGFGAESLITEHLDLWTSAVSTRSSTGRGSNKKIELYGIKKLRELILELAVRGKLVSQYPNDEPASELLKKIEEEKARLVNAKKIRKPKPVPPIERGEVPYDVPKNWSWARLGEITNYGYSDKVDATSVSDRTWVLELEDVEKSSSKLIQKIRFSSRQFKSSKNSFSVGDVLYGKLRPYLDKVLIADEAGVCTTEMIPVRAYTSEITSEYVRLCLKSPRFIQYANESTHGMNLPRMGTDKARAALVPIAPTSEQHRIVAKVDELMTLCDHLESETEHNLNAHATLADTLLNSLARVEGAAELVESWQRLEQNWDLLFPSSIAGERAIEKLRKTILRLAVVGRLTPQDPNDEPSRELLGRLQASRDQWLSGNSLVIAECNTMVRKLSKLEEPKRPFEIPETWEFSHLIQLSQMMVDCHNKTAPYVSEGIPIIRTTNIRNRRFKFDDLKFVDEETYEYWSRRCPPQSGDLIFTREAPMGEAAIVPNDERWCLGQRTMLIRPMHDYICKEYLLLALTEPQLLERASENAVGSTVKHLRVGDVEKLEIPVPPLSEQERIVNKFNELMELCDQLERRLRSSQKVKMELSNSLYWNVLF